MFYLMTNFIYCYEMFSHDAFENFINAISTAGVMNLTGKKILLGVTGGIACYKAVSLARLLVKQGAAVYPIMTRAATEFVKPLTFQAITGHPVHSEMFGSGDHAHIEHISVTQDADVFVIAPATANIVAKIAHGIADDFLSTVVLASTAPLVIAPAMNCNMWDNVAVQSNISAIRKRGVKIIPPGSGELACGTTGAGRMAEPEDIMAFILRETGQERTTDNRLLANKSILITAGPTQEKIDAVRYISNYSSGKMGYAIADYCRQVGGNVTLISGPVALAPPEGIKLIYVTSADEMYEAVMSHYETSDLISKAAEESDYKSKKISEKKSKKKSELKIDLIPTKDILLALGKKKTSQYLVGFAAETDDVKGYAKQKLLAKNLDLIVANDVSQPGAGFGVETNIVTLISPDKEVELPLMTKKEVAERLIQFIVDDPKWRG